MRPRNILMKRREKYSAKGSCTMSHAGRRNAATLVTVEDFSSTGCANSSPAVPMLRSLLTPTFGSVCTPWLSTTDTVRLSPGVSEPATNSKSWADGAEVENTPAGPDDIDATLSTTSTPGGYSMTALTWVEAASPRLATRIVCGATFV